MRLGISALLFNLDKALELYKMLKSQEIFNIITICLKLRNFIFESSIHIRKVQNVVFSIVFIDSFLNSL